MIGQTVSDGPPAQGLTMLVRALVTLAAVAVLGPLVVAHDSAWWKDAVYYRLLVDSFKDSDGDGLGDLTGTSKQLSYVRALGADAVLLSPLSVQSDDCAKPGVTRLSEVDPRYGNLADLLQLLEKAKRLEIRTVLELPVQSVSLSSEWFVESSKKSPGFDDWIVWKEDQPTEQTPGIESWVLDEQRAAYWASQSNRSLLNLCSDGLRAALAAAQCAWLRRGVSGVLINPDFALDHNCSLKLVRQLALTATDCARSAGLEPSVVIVESDQDISKASEYYQAGAKSVISNAFSSNIRSTTPEYALNIHAANLYVPYDLKPSWITSKLGNGRVTTRLGGDMVDAINLLTLTLPGAAVIQQGDELGAADTLLEWVQPGGQCWPSKMLAAAAPFPWDDTVKGGFSSGEPWLPLAPNYRYANAKNQFTSDTSHAGVVRTAAAMRRSPAIGPHVVISRLDNVLTVLRWGGTGSLILACNLGTEPSDIRLAEIAGLANELTVAASSAGSATAAGVHVQADKTLRLIPGEAVLMAGPPRHCGGPGPVDKITSKLTEGWQKLNKYFGE